MRYCDACYLECCTTHRVGNDDVCPECFQSYFLTDLDDLFMLLNHILPMPEAEPLQEAA